MYFRANLYESEEKDSDWGAPIKPPDFLIDRTKIADTKEELVRVIAAGVGVFDTGMCAFS